MKKSIILTIALALSLVIVSGCTKAGNQTEDATQNTPIGPGMMVLPPDPEPDVTVPEAPSMDERSATSNLSGEEKCGIENCHGYDITCGPDVPEVCSEIYQLGDFCRQYAVCEVFEDACALVPNEKFGQCVDCVKPCEELGGEPAFECEAACRNELE